MADFKYSAKTIKGESISGTISAKDRGQALEELRRKELTVLDVKQVGFGSRAGVRGKKKKLARAGKPRKDELVVFTRQLSTMVGAGIPLLECLEILVEQAETPAFGRTLEGVVDEVRSGKDLSESLKRYNPKVFSDLFISMVRAAEASGQLDIILVRLAEYLEDTAALKREIRAAMTYPVISLVLVVGITAFLMIGIVPKFKDIFDALDIELPALTAFVMEAAFFCKDYWYIVGAGMFAAFTAFVMFRKTERGHYITDSILLKLPVFGPLFHKVALSRFAKTFSTLIKSGVPILASMEIVAETSGNRVISKAVRGAQGSVRQGDTLSEPLARSGAFPPMVTKMVGIGEKSGALETLLDKISIFYDQQVKAAVKSLTSMIEPILITVMGVMVGTIVLAVFLPIFKIQESLAKGH